MNIPAIIVGLIIVSLTILFTYVVIKFEEFARKVKQEEEEEARSLAESKSRATECVTRMTAAKQIEGRGIFDIDAPTMGLTASTIYIELEAFAEKVYQIPLSSLKEPEFMALSILEPGDSVKVRVDEKTDTLWSIYHVK